jgi:glutamate-1-semialdehyde 2,1-aminomutase/spore coat polysaccharide biosynthesis protein SpsF
MKTVAIIAARMGSERLPGKVMMDLDDQPVLWWVIDAAHRTILVNEVWVATTTETRDNAIHQWCEVRKQPCWRGSEEDVLDRFLGCAQEAKADVIVRLTGDCPFLNPKVIDEVIMLRQQTGVHYASNVDPATYPDGLDTQVLTFEALATAHREAVRATDRDTVCEYVGRNRDRWPSRNLVCPVPDLAGQRWVLDTAEDYAFCQAAVAELGNSAQDMIAMLDLMQKRPDIRAINSMWKRNERFFKKVAEDIP